MKQRWAKLERVAQGKLTPMLRQYLEAKSECPDSILFFRMGDFFEMFFEDAIEAAELLGLALTSRDGSDKKERVPMCGVPFRAAAGYVARLIKAGRTVTICDQIEDPKEAKGVVKRAIVRTVTPGTVLEPDLLEETANNYLGALFLRDKKAGLAFIDVSTGEFLAAQVDADAERALSDELTRMTPAEVVTPTSLDADLMTRLRTRFGGTAFTARPDEDFDHALAKERLIEQFDLGTLKGVALEDAPEALAAAGAAREAGIPVVIDAGTLREGVRELLPLCDYIVASELFAGQISEGG
ncbi:MAG TPA: hypothetical protein HPP77_07345, partial [Candidatus Hydrogenedentes bacterium]|nr:hypothetical protein [Candidatus Hydrogenedentota bacterium]